MVNISQTKNNKDVALLYVFFFLHSFQLISTYLTSCGNKMPTRCNRSFYCTSYCLLNMFQEPLCPSSGAQEHYTVVATRGIWCCGFQVVVLGRWLKASWMAFSHPPPKHHKTEPVKQHPANRTHSPQLHTRPATWKSQHQIPQAATTV